MLTDVDATGDVINENKAV